MNMLKVALLSLLAAAPSSTNFTLNAYDFGNGAGAPSSTNYQLKASTGAQGGNLTSTSYTLPAGIRASATVATPPAPTFTNPSSQYNRLQVTLNVSGFASDTTYLIAISDDDFVTTYYVQTDQTIATNLGLSNYQTYAAWGGASGSWILGLNPGTTYKVKVAALQGSATGSGFGPTASAATVATSLTFALSTSLTGTPPFAVGFGSLTPGSVISGDATVTATISTNALGGGNILLRGQNGGLTSTVAAYTISSATADLTAANNGYGAQISSTSQGSGGPMTGLSPFNGASGNVGQLGSSWQPLASFAGPVTTGVVTTTLKAKSGTLIPAAADYTDTLTMSVSLVF